MNGYLRGTAKSMGGKGCAEISVHMSGYGNGGSYASAVCLP